LVPLSSGKNITRGYIYTTGLGYLPWINQYINHFNEIWLLDTITILIFSEKITQNMAIFGLHLSNDDWQFQSLYNRPLVCIWHQDVQQWVLVVLRAYYTYLPDIGSEEVWLNNQHWLCVISGQIDQCFLFWVVYISIILRKRDSPLET